MTVGHATLAVEAEVLSHLASIIYIYIYFYACVAHIGRPPKEPPEEGTWRKNCWARVAPHLPFKNTPICTMTLLHVVTNPHEVEDSVHKWSDPAPMFSHETRRRFLFVHVQSGNGSAAEAFERGYLLAIIADILKAGLLRWVGSRVEQRVRLGLSDLFAEGVRTKQAKRW